MPTEISVGSKLSIRLYLWFPVSQPDQPPVPGFGQPGGQHVFPVGECAIALFHDRTKNLPGGGQVALPVAGIAALQQLTHGQRAPVRVAECGAESGVGGQIVALCLPVLECGTGMVSRGLAVAVEMIEGQYFRYADDGRTRRHLLPKCVVLGITQGGNETICSQYGLAPGQRGMERPATAGKQGFCLVEGFIFGWHERLTASAGQSEVLPAAGRRGRGGAGGRGGRRRGREARGPG